ncbi:MAG: polymerase sigma-E factor [Planctomycetota bacterium]|jgi:RNA polymerase sigma-70 factor (ECF subfamily)
MSGGLDGDRLLLKRLRAGDQTAWRELIDRFEGRLHAYVDARVRDRAACEDIVQETLIGFHGALAHFADDKPIENYLFRIAAHKRMDYMRQAGRRQRFSGSLTTSSGGDWDIVASSQRGASSIVRNSEQQRIEETAIVAALAEQITRWRERGDWRKLECVELLFVRGWPNKRVAETLGISEQQVANFKYDAIEGLRKRLGNQHVAEGPLS